jgi:hypothetical protein
VKENEDTRRERRSHEDAEEIGAILSAVSSEVPGLIKNIIASVFSEEAGRNMGKAAGSFYKELKDSGIPAEIALRMTEDYMKTFTSLGDLIKGVGKGKTGPLNVSVGSKDSGSRTSEFLRARTRKDSESEEDE